MPKVEVIESDKILPTDYLTIDLLAPEPFDPSLFDELAFKLGSESGQVFLKYIVGDNKMFVFPDSECFSHADFFKFVMRERGELCSVGRISLIIEGDRTVFRRIGGDAMTLIKWLRSEPSKSYRRTTIADKLGDFFEVKD